MFMRVNTLLGSCKRKSRLWLGSSPSFSSLRLVPLDALRIGILGASSKNFFGKRVARFGRPVTVSSTSDIVSLFQLPIQTPRETISSEPCQSQDDEGKPGLHHRSVGEL